MKYALRFITLRQSMNKLFDRAKTSIGLHLHDLAKMGQEVPVHQHRTVALYRVEGKALFRDGNGLERVLNSGEAVLVPARQKHGWLSLQEGTLIEHVLGKNHVQAVLNAA